jgi:ELWxxDGT repeat protein
MSRSRLVRDIFPGFRSSSPSNLTAVGRTLFFVANNGTNGYELWRSDGSRAGTAQVADIDPDFDTALDIGPPTAVGSTLFFSARDSVFDQELWKSDGTKSGTVRVADIWPGQFGGSSPYQLTAVGGTLFFIANDGGSTGYGGGFELWKSNGTAAKTTRITNFTQRQLERPGGLFFPRLLTVVSNTLFFVADDGVNGIELWKSDGTVAGTRIIKDILPGPGGSAPEWLTAIGNQLFFLANDGTHGKQLWKSDGTRAGTVRLTNLSSSYIKELTTAGNTLFFVKGNALWKSDGSVPGTVQVLDFDRDNPYNLTAVGNNILFSAKDKTYGRELWKSDGTTAGTVLVADIEPGSLFGGIPLSSSPTNLKAVGNMLYFSAQTLSTGRELWKTDGTASGTARVADIKGGSNGSYPSTVTAVGRDLFFSADNGTNGRELYFLDLTPPSLSSVSAEGNRLILNFSESVSFTGSIADRFSITVNGASRIFAVSTGATSSELRLTLAGTAPTSSQIVRVNYSDLTNANDERGVIQDAEGNDMVSIVAPGRPADTFRSNMSVTELAATTSNLVLTGSSAINGTGNNLSNTIIGNGATNILNGGAAADRLIGGDGKDTLIGGLGADVFRFDSALRSTANRDTITDFNRFQGDRIELENAVFTGLTRTGTLAGTAFRSGSNFNSPSQRILYNPATGHLSYDSNGNTAGGLSVLIAILSTKPTLNNTMFAIT